MRSVLSILLFIVPMCFKAQENVVDERSGVIISFDSGQDIFPESWKTATINANGNAITVREHERSKDIILKALAKYPTAVLQKNLRHVYILSYIEFYGQAFGGTNSSDDVYLTNSGIENGYDDHYIEQIFHAEFSSILLRNYYTYFNEEAWKNNNSGEIKYGEGGVAALKTGETGDGFDPTLNAAGFLNQYGMSDMENDFNSFAKNMFKPTKGYRQVVQDYPGIAGKQKLFVEFYSIIDPFFTAEYFENFYE